MADGVTGSVLVTGATGFIGRDLVRRLAASGWRVRAAVRAPVSIPSAPRIEPVAVGDLAAPVDWNPLLEGVSYVVHLAGLAHSTTAIPESTYMAVNAEATRSLAAAARRAGVTRVVLVSSVRAQCGPAAQGILTEDRPSSPTDAYGRSKLAGEQLLAKALAGASTDWCTLRPVVLYGSGVKANMRALSRLARSPLPLPLGSLPARRSILGLPNMHAAVVHALLSPAVARGTYLVADPGPLTIGEIVGAMRRGLDRSPRVFGVPIGPASALARALGKGDAWERMSGDLVVSTDALQATGWQAVETAAEGLARWLAEETRSVSRSPA